MLQADERVDAGLIVRLMEVERAQRGQSARELDHAARRDQPAVVEVECLERDQRVEVTEARVGDRGVAQRQAREERGRRERREVRVPDMLLHRILPRSSTRSDEVAMLAINAGAQPATSSVTRSTRDTTWALPVISPSQRSANRRRSGSASTRATLSAVTDVFGAQLTSSSRRRVWRAARGSARSDRH